MTVDLKSFRGETMEVSRSMTDAMWTWRMRIDKTYPIPDQWSDIQLIEEDAGKPYCLIRGFPLMMTSTDEESDSYRDVEGHSYGWYVANKPIFPADRLLKSSISGTTITVEDPVTYLDRLIFTNGGTPCGLQQAAWISATPGWGGADLPYQQFESNENSTVQSVIDEINEYTGLIHYDRWVQVGADWIPVSYLLPQDLIDTQMGLSAPLIISNNGKDIRDNRVLSGISTQEDGTKWKNRVLVYGTLQGTGTIYSHVHPVSWDIDAQGLERFYQYCYQLAPTLTEVQASALVKAKAEALHSLLCTSTTTFEVKFWRRFDIQLWQQIQFSGFPNIPGDMMRVIEIRYNWTADDGGWGAPVCSVRCAIDREWAGARKLALILKQDYWALSESVKRAIDQKTKIAFAGNSVAYGPTGTAILKSASGALVYATTPNQ